MIWGYGRYLFRVLDTDLSNSQRTRARARDKIILKIVLMRHGEAQARSGPDSSRQLNSFGEREVIASAGRIIRRVQPQSIVSSPYLRAQQTAHLIRDLLNRELAVDTWDEITPTGNCVLVRDKLLKTALINIMLVTHQPFISAFILYLTGQEIPMATAMVASIHTEVMAEEGGEIEWVEHGARD